MANTPDLLEKIDHGLGRIAGVFAIAGGIFLMALVLVTIVAVVARYILNDPIFGIGDISYMTLSLFVALAIFHAARSNAHVSVNVLSMLAGRRLTRFTDVAVRLLAIGITGFASYSLMIKGGCGFKCGAFTANLEITHQPFYYVLSLAMGLYAVHLAVHLLIGLVHFKGEDPNEIRD